MTRKTFLYAYLAAAVLVAAVNSLNVITMGQEQPQLGFWGPVIWEGTSWVSLMLFFWIPWIGYRLAPPAARPRWRLLLHLPVALAFALCHVATFVGLRALIYRLAGDTYDYGAFWPHFLYELRKDSLGYALFILGFWLIEHLLRQQQLTLTPGQSLTFDIRDGARLTRVSLADILAVTSAGNYVEFVLADGRRLMMRSPLSALESELQPRGFLRTHRSWLVNAARMTALKPEGSGDYTVELESLSAPLSRRFPEALAKLKGG
ncbi:MAG TPA: LytTR family DNA-binding domain-containing protein [Rhizomicrobium sp.]|nr:LytTR family DNA-binding domain-containing protein [Rhizomicrobium sp.]